MDCNIICGEHFDLVRAVVVIDNALYVNGLTFINICCDKIAILVRQDCGTDIDVLAVHHTGQGKSPP